MAVLAAACFPLGVGIAQDSLCAQVRIEIVQELSLERQGFEARLAIDNGVPDVPVEDVGVDLTFADATGNPVAATSDPNNLAAKFYYRLQSGSTIPTSIPGGTSARIAWLIVPTRGAGGTNSLGELYAVGATLRYRAGGKNESVDVSPDTIRVKPMPDLAIEYFLPSEVQGDDPFTEEAIEPALPFSLGVRVRNGGRGPARALKIESAQPTIIDNRQGLLVDFRIEGAEVNGKLSVASLVADLGDLQPGRAAVARWVMTCSLAGRFRDFEAHCTHADELGGELTSLFSGDPVTHTLVRDVLVDLPGRDTVRDFLARDGDVLSVYESENTDAEVADRSPVSAVVATGNGQYRVTTLGTPGCLYLRLADPAPAGSILKLVRRADGKALAAANAWQSAAQDPGTHRWSRYVHLFDVNNPSGLAYTLHLQESAATNRPPVIAAIADRTIYVGTTLAFSISASDPDGGRLSYRLVSGPTNATLDTATGQFRWRPTRSQSGRSSPVAVEVTDDGTPSLSASASFTVQVLPVEGFHLALGRTNLFAGESNAIPITLRSDLGLTNVAFVVSPTTDGRLTNFALTAIGPEVYRYTMTPLNSNRFALAFDVDPNRIQFNARQLALLAFGAAPVDRSAIVPLGATEVRGRDTGGDFVINGMAVDGQVVVVGREPVLEAQRDATLVLYGLPGAVYDVESRTGQGPDAPWVPRLSLLLDGRFRILPVEPASPMTLYRAKESIATPPSLVMVREGEHVGLDVSGLLGASYVVLSSPALADPSRWSAVGTVTITNTPQFFAWPDANEPLRFFELRAE